MIRLGLRLTLAGGREAAGRLTLIAAAVALGVGMLLGTLAAINGTDTQNARNAWLNTGAVASPSATASTADPLWWLLRADNFDGRTIGRVDVAASGPQSPVPPGIPRLPGPGQFYASPALSELIRSTPAAELAARFPGRQAGTIGPAALPGPDSLIIIIGHSPDQLSKNREAERVTSITDVTPSSCAGPDCGVRVGIDANGIALVLSVVAVALIFPVLILIGTATRLSAARREQRFAAMRLVGATPRQISVISAVESTVAAVLGVALGFGLFFLFRPVLAAVDFTGTRFFTDDLSLGLSDVLFVAAGVPAGAVVVARIALRRVQISPLGVTRRVTPRPPRVYRLLPLAAGLGELAYFIGRVPESISGQIGAFIPGALLVLAGIVIAGPWLTMAGARVLARRTGRPAALVAGRRLSDDPRAGFRAVSGLVLALCVTSGTVGVITAMAAERGLPKSDAAIGNTVIADFVHGRAASGQPVAVAAPPRDAVQAQLHSIPGVRGVTVIHTNPLGTPDPAWGDPDEFGPPHPAGLASCAQLATTPAFSVCPPGAESASVAPNFGGFGYGPPNSWPRVWPAAAISTRRLQDLPVQQVVVATDGSKQAIERARTVLANAYPDELIPDTIAEERAWSSRNLAEFQQLANVVILVSFPIAGCSLAVSVAGGLSDRKRPFSLLRLTGVPLGVLRRVVLLESAVPLLAVALVAIGTGFLAAQLFLQAQFGYSLRAPGPAYYLTVLGGLVTSLGIIASTLPLLRRITGPETARNE
ncbi:FtsX-like permease family protein [Actinomadura scrupuli]|uniref:FtsX-like permease family protein n=1 Tax=Actinomadura scrupuli TaxID=559629 RepID=UPI003D992849